MRKIVLLGLMLATGCSKPHGDAPQTASPETYKSPQGTLYAVSRVPGVKQSDLPVNADFKMADLDLAKYAGTACALDVPPKYAQDRCDIYVQSDPNGTLIGYAILTQDHNGVNLNTATTLNEKKEPGGKRCIISGKIESIGISPIKQIADANKDFDGQFMYSAWQKDPGNYLISPASSDDLADVEPDHALGVWYVAKKGDKLRISQERWNYCYSDSSVNVDDVFYRAISLTRIMPEKP
jgi:hypothetical protein